MPETIAPEKFIINGQEYDPEEASSLIELGNKYRETEKNLNTSLDKLMPEYTKATQRAARADALERELAEEKRKLEEFQAKATKTETPENVTAAREQARKIGLIDEDYINTQGYVKKSDLDSYFSEKENQRKLVDNVIKQADVLEKEIDGSDGRVPFNQKAVLAYASAYNISDLKQAYEEMNEGGNARWKEEQIEKAKRPGLTTLTPGGKKIPAETKITDDNFKQAWEELYGNS